mgnify:CR=1 FL=1
MKTHDEIKKQLTELTRTDKKKIDEFCDMLKQFGKTGKVNEDGAKTLQGVSNELLIFTTAYINRLVNLLKQNHMLN